jgi:hypothetical protein
LLHYHAFSTHGKDSVIKSIVTNEAEAARQKPVADAVLREAMTEVLLRMHALQQQEQNTLRADPLQLLALHAPSSSAMAAVMDVSAPPLQHQPKRSSAAYEAAHQNTKKLKKDNLWNVTSEHRGEGDFAREDEALRRSLLRQVSGGGQDAAAEEEYLHSRGPPCTRCGSEHTLAKYDTSMSGMSGTRGEVWGSKDQESGVSSRVTVLCKACGHEKIVLSS